MVGPEYSNGNVTTGRGICPLVKSEARCYTFVCHRFPKILTDFYYVFWLLSGQTIRNKYCINKGMNFTPKNINNIYTKFISYLYGMK